MKVGEEDITSLSKPSNGEGLLSKTEVTFQDIIGAILRTSKIPIDSPLSTNT